MSQQVNVLTKAVLIVSRIAVDQAHGERLGHGVARLFQSLEGAFVDGVGLNLKTKRQHSVDVRLFMATK